MFFEEHLVAPSATESCASIVTLEEVYEDIRDLPEDDRPKEKSPLHKWCSDRTPGFTDCDLLDCSRDVSSLPLFPHVDDIVYELIHSDVVLMTAPTASGKSLLAPYIFTKYQKEIVEYSMKAKREFERANKCLMFVPNSEQVGAVTRMASKMYMRKGIACQVGGYYNPHHEVRRDRRANSLSSSTLDFNLVSYEFGEKLLSDAFLNMLILDEAHESNPAIMLSMAAGLKMMSGEKKERRLDKMLLMTATMAEKDIDDLKKYFEKAGLTFSVLSFDQLPRSKRLTVSCLARKGATPPAGFTHTNLSASLYKFKPSYELEEKNNEPNMKMIEDRLSSVLDAALGMAAQAVNIKLAPHVPSIVVILPGIESVEAMYGRVRHMSNFRGPADLPMNEQEDLFVPLRITSSLKDDEHLTSPCEVYGKWGGRKGRIIFTTSLISAGLTIPGAQCIIDGGVIKIRSEYQINGLFSLDKNFIDRDMMVQRAGRTARTHDGEYCIVLSGERVEEIKQRSLKIKQLTRHFDEIHWFRAKFFNLRMVWKPDGIVKERFITSYKNKGYFNGNSFTPTTLFLYEYFPFLTPDLSRIVIQGIKLGLAAHAVLYVADLVTKIKFIASSSKGREERGGPSMDMTATDIFANAMYNEMIDEGDSIARADFIVTFFQSIATSTRELNKAGDVKNIETGDWADGNFWKGRWTKNDENPKDFGHLYSLFVRDEGRDSTRRARREIEGACHALSLIKGMDLFHPDINRYITHKDNYCLNNDGRALFIALLTMHSSRVCRRMEEIGGRRRRMREDDGEKYQVYDDNLKMTVMMQPERHKWRDSCDEMQYGRFMEGIKRGRTDIYTACIDPISLTQLAFFANINSQMEGKAVGKQEEALTLRMNAAPEKDGIRLITKKETANRVIVFRDLLRDSSEKLIKSTNYEIDLSRELERTMIDMWKKCSEKEENDDYYGKGDGK